MAMYAWIVFQVLFVVFLILHLVLSTQAKRMVMYEKDPDVSKIKFTRSLSMWFMIGWMLSLLLMIFSIIRTS
ncbi:hypothetical protein SAMN02799630_01734 [Paenibacillus sp. UNCCL117]|uniref:hypothetical protein n=1 Tax=unclassified Paenibacillus TaxID=185978 RepID=UPI000888C44A|nr:MULTISPECIES: hypothetical protein [unclassified Paenibacillus]SDC92275.1 hypothetical protein SAMN04488602_104221 [Paenibacillus sp. cl123]SFW29302.1 hypothetical protein SAMN02799630_01734 [Paenibacillus sp. UNCCL117]